MVEKGGQRFVNIHEKIYIASPQANEHGVFAEVNAKHEVANKQPLDFSITKKCIYPDFSSVILAIVFIGVS